MEPYEEWKERVSGLLPAPSIAEVVVDGEVIYACAKDPEGRVIDIWDPDDVGSPFKVDALN